MSKKLLDKLIYIEAQQRRHGEWLDKWRSEAASSVNNAGDELRKLKDIIEAHSLELRQKRWKWPKVDWDEIGNVFLVIGVGYGLLLLGTWLTYLVYGVMFK